MFVMTPGRCGKVAPRSLLTWLPDVKLSADRTHRRNSICPELLGEQLSRLFLYGSASLPVADVSSTGA
jgi:hypothetical protein